MFLRSIQTLTVAFLLVTTAHFCCAEKRALIVAIGEYPIESGWNKLSSVNDARIIKESLLKQGFDQSRIDIITNKQATKQGILQAMSQLVRKSQPNDVVVFHFSGHGQQVTDISGDEPDGLDEALVAYDTPKSNTNNSREAKFHMLDDELNVFLLQLRTKVGADGDVLFLLDACHSGTAHRSFADNSIYRGTNELYKIDGYHHIFKNPDIDMYVEKQKHVKSSIEQQLSPYCVISACLPQQMNKEYNGFGSLSYAVSRSLSKELTNSSYQTFFEELRVDMLPMAFTSTGYRHNQTPQIEGIVNRRLFGGKAIQQPVFIRVNNVKGKRVVVNAGNLAGIFKGADISLYPANTYERSRSQPIVICKVDSATLFESIFTVPDGLDAKQLLNAKAFVKRYVYTSSTGETAAQMRARMLRTAQSTNKKVTMELIPLLSNGDYQDLNDKYKHGNLHFKFNDRFVLRITNSSNAPVYFQVIDILPNDNISILVGGQRAADYYLNAGESKIYKNDIIIVDAFSPLGQETLVLIATGKLLDLSAIEQQRPTPKRAVSNELEEWLNELYASTRSISPFESTKIHIDSKSFIVNAN